jgi:hypothetical protein
MKPKELVNRISLNNFQKLFFYDETHLFIRRTYLFNDSLFEGTL